MGKAGSGRLIEGQAIPLATLFFMFLLSGCGTPQPMPPARQAAPPGGQLEFSLASGTYGCDDRVRIQVDREVRDRRNVRINIAWDGKRYRLERDPSYSGLPRFEDMANGLVWIDLPWKGVLLDSKTNKPLVNECRPV